MVGEMPRLFGLPDVPTFGDEREAVDDRLRLAGNLLIGGRGRNVFERFGTGSDASLGLRYAESFPQVAANPDQDVTMTPYSSNL